VSGFRETLSGGNRTSIGDADKIISKKSAGTFPNFWFISN
jgi:hypothetical protein